MGPGWGKRHSEVPQDISYLVSSKLRATVGTLSRLRFYRANAGDAFSKLEFVRGIDAGAPRSEPTHAERSPEEA